MPLFQLDANITLEATDLLDGLKKLALHFTWLGLALEFEDVDYDNNLIKSGHMQINRLDPT